MLTTHHYIFNPHQTKQLKSYVNSSKFIMDWTRGPTIGHGSSATVSVAKCNNSGDLFAVKSAELSQSQLLQKEQQFLSTLSCAQIVSYKGCNISTENGTVLYNLFIEYAPAGTLSDSIRIQGGSLNESTIKTYTRPILLGLQYLHSKGIAHCDIKGQNILVTGEGAKIADLGCARRVDYDDGSVPICGTPVYMAPEVARGEEQGFAADVWALGCTVIEMATGRAPWSDVSDPVSGLYRIGYSGEVPEIPGSLSKRGREFVSKCLKRDPLERWSACELLKHDFFADEEPNWSNSPTTVLDHHLYGLWDFEQDHLDSDHNRNPTHESSCSNSARERIRQLSEGKAASFLGLPNWACDEDWVTVRSNNIEHSDGLPWNEAHDYDEPTNTNISSNSIGLGLDNCNAVTFCSSRDRKLKCKKYNVFCGNLNFVNKELWLFDFVHGIIHQLLIILLWVLCFILSYLDWA